jgi:hypothetical protein
MKARRIIGLLLISFQALAKEPTAPWLTGPLIAPPGTAIPYGDLLFKTYLFFTADTGAYNRHWKEEPSRRNLYSLSLQGFYFFGLTPWCDLNIVPRYFYQRSGGAHSAFCGDLTVGLDFQLLDPERTPYFPGIKLAVREVFPTGNFEYLRPRKLLTDLTGRGTFATQFDLVLYKLFHLHRLNWLSATLSAEYTINTPVDVHGFNAYGGGFGATGRALPGNVFEATVSFELTLSRSWALSFDTVYNFEDAAAFFGREGISLDGALAPVGRPCSTRLSLAPAVEYNFGSHFGIIAGAYFSVLGKNSDAFRGGAINFNYLY